MPTDTEPQWYRDQQASMCRDSHGMWPIPKAQRDSDWLAAKAAGDQYLLDQFNRPTPMQIPFKRLHPAAITPVRAHDTDAGYDLFALPSDRYSPEKQFAIHPALQPGERRLFSTGIAVAIPPGYYGRVAPRSGLAMKQGLDVLAGVVDSGYRGPVGVLLLNTGADPVWIEAGQRIAQLIIERCHDAEFVETEDLEDSTRGAGGYGSTGST